jgi:hypothetical protein
MATMLTKGGINCDWIEAYCAIPEGARVGEWMIMQPWQREFVYEIYNNQGDGSYITPDAEEKVLERLLDDNDRKALTLAMEQCRALDTKRATQLDQILTQRPLHRTAMLGCLVMQSKNLDLKPQDIAPCHIINENTKHAHRQAAAKLVRKLLNAGVSRCHPNPMQALREANGKSPAD